MANGTVKWFNSEKGFGFIQADDLNIDVFVHVSSLKKSGLETLRDGQRVSFVITEGKSGKKQASEIKALSEPDRIPQQRHRDQEERQDCEPHQHEPRARRNQFEDDLDRHMKGATGKNEIDRRLDSYFREISKWK